MKLRGTPTYGGVTYYRLIGSVFEGDRAQAGDAQLAHGGNARRDGLLLRADSLRLPGMIVAGTPPHQEQKRDREDSPASQEPEPVQEPGRG